MSNKLYSIISKVMDVPESEINDQTSPENIESWDSFHGLVLVDELENNFNVKFTIEEIADVQNVGDIKRHIKNHNIDLDE
jgi:acyl carrier protein|tara:strand:- start:153 stop:392 length:240 start_codon:yes stop_codon:yes gene_type:complete